MSAAVKHARKINSAVVIVVGDWRKVFDGAHVYIICHFEQQARAGVARVRVSRQSLQVCRARYLIRAVRENQPFDCRSVLKDNIAVQFQRKCAVSVGACKFIARRKHLSVRERAAQNYRVARSVVSLAANFYAGAARECKTFGQLQITKLTALRLAECSRVVAIIEVCATG